MSSKKGRESELRFMLAMLEAGYEVAQPVNPSERYDVVVRAPSVHHWNTVQVKTAWRSAQNTVRVSLQRAFRYSSDAFDFLGIVYDQHVWLIPWNKVALQHTVVLSLHGGKYADYRVGSK